MEEVKCSLKLEFTERYTSTKFSSTFYFRLKMVFFLGWTCRKVRFVTVKDVAVSEEVTFLFYECVLEGLQENGNSTSLQHHTLTRLTLTMSRKRLCILRSNSYSGFVSPSVFSLLRLVYVVWWVETLGRLETWSNNTQLCKWIVNLVSLSFKDNEHQVSWDWICRSDRYVDEQTGTPSMTRSA